MAADEMPPAKAFWSFTLYDTENGFFMPNDKKKYSVGENGGMKLNADGGIDIYIAAEKPEVAAVIGTVLDDDLGAFADQVGHGEGLRDGKAHICTLSCSDGQLMRNLLASLLSLGHSAFSHMSFTHGSEMASA